MSWTLRSMAQNEFFGKSYDYSVNITGGTERAGTNYLKVRGGTGGTFY